MQPDKKEVGILVKIEDNKDSRETKEKAEERCKAEREKNNTKLKEADKIKSKLLLSKGIKKAKP
jgi:hypothetical protein